MIEEYKTLKDYPHYRFYPDGRIYSDFTKRFIGSFNDGKGYMQSFLYTGNHKERRCVKTHILIAKAFIPNPNGYKEVNHKDFDKSNNHIDNLEWCDKATNMQHAANGHRCDSMDRSPMTEEMVRFIPTMLKYGMSVKLISKLYRVSHITIRKILSGHTWRSLNLTFNRGKFNRGTIELPEDVYDMLASFNVDNTVLNARVKRLASV